MHDRGADIRIKNDRFFKLMSVVFILPLFLVLGIVLSPYLLSYSL